MEEVFECLILLIQISLYTVAFKSIVGLRFPWEKCQCCGKKWSEHKEKE